ncbi:autotransporter domain-containing protein [Pseudomonas chlororaphis]|uniref:autotransporter domain-containing protein n=1 Tax=Pseudomonas chlororaphis TaxID=587753 RepID=UPI0021557191|nr:autotransporter domain-containing protein [Pseudomonas chlororaphis]
MNVGGSGKLNVADGFTLGTVQGATGKATFNNGATLNTGGDLIVGKGGSTDLNLKSGSQAYSQGDTLTSDKRLMVGGAGNGTLLVKNGSQVNSQDSIIAADLGVAKVGGGTVLTGENTYNGGMLISNGTLQLGAGANGGYSDHLKSKHDANTLQAFGELGRRFDLSPSVQLEPFANLAYVQVKSEGFKEDGGPAALRAKHASDEQTLSTLGLRASADKQLDNGKLLTVFGSAGWKHALAGITPSNTHRFDGSDAFRTEGAAYSRNSAVVEAGGKPGDSRAEPGRRLQRATGQRCRRTRPEPERQLPLLTLY